MTQARTGWIALSDRGTAPPAMEQPLPQGRLVFELARPLAERTTLLQRQTANAALYLTASMARGIELDCRQGATIFRQRLSRPCLAGLGLAQLHYTWDLLENRWSLEFHLPDGEDPVLGGGTGALPFSRADLAALIAPDPGQPRDAALLWYGATTGGMPAQPALLGPRTLIETPAGLKAAGDLKPGDLVRTADRSLPVLAVHRPVLPGRGSFAPIRLRAPYFSAVADMLVSPSQPVVLTGVEVEYLFGADAVLVEARHLVDGARAVAEDSRTALPWIALDLGCAAALHVAGCELALPGPDPTARALAPTLDRFEARTLMAMRRRGATRSAA